MQTVFVLGLTALILRELDILDYHIYYSDSTADLEKIYSRCIDDGSADNSSDIQMVSWYIATSNAQNPLGGLVSDRLTGRLKSITPPTGVVNFQLDKVDLRGRY